MIRIVADSHVDHGVPPDLLAWALAQMVEVAPAGVVTVKTFEMPTWARDLPCALIGPITGGPLVTDRDVVWARRGPRPRPSRCVVADPVPSRLVTVVVGPDGGEMVLYTIYGGPKAPPEPHDPVLHGKPVELAEAEAFWGIHALAFNPAWERVPTPAIPWSPWG